MTNVEQYDELMEELLHLREHRNGLPASMERTFTRALEFWWNKMTAEEREAAEARWKK